MPVCISLGVAILFVSVSAGVVFGRGVLVGLVVSSRVVTGKLKFCLI
jgi:hypothetical protein